MIEVTFGGLTIASDVPNWDRRGRVDHEYTIRLSLLAAYFWLGTRQASRPSFTRTADRRDWNAKNQDGTDLLDAMRPVLLLGAPQELLQRGVANLGDAWRATDAANAWEGIRAAANARRGFPNFDAFILGWREYRSRK